MTFRNSILAGEELVRTGIRSANYVAGVAGWRVDRDGNAEFNDVIIRGELIAGTYPAGPFVQIAPDISPTPDVTPGMVMKGPGPDFGFIYRPAGGGVWIVSTDAINLFPDAGSIVNVMGVLWADSHVLLDAGTDPVRAASGWFGGTTTADGSPIQAPSDATFRVTGGRRGTTVVAGDYHRVDLPVPFPSELVGFSIGVEVASGGPGIHWTPTVGSSDRSEMLFRLWRSDTGAKVTTPQTVVWTAIGY